MKIVEGDSLREAAAQWHERISRDPGTQVPETFERWKETSDAHRQAYEQVTKAWNLLKGSGQDPALLALRHETALRLTRRNSRRVRPLSWAAVAIVVTLLGILVIGLSSQGWFTRHPNRYATAIGERLTASLADGSQVTLNSGTELQVEFNSLQRRVILARGQAFFEVARDAVRPFVVDAAGRRFIALGTAFDVRIDGEKVQLTMLEGKVRFERLTSVSTAVPSPIGTNTVPEALPPLTAGEQLTVDAHEVTRIREADPQKVTSWRRGQVIFENTRLADAVDELNRYSDVKIELADPKLADLKISGAFATGHPTLFVEAMTNYFPVQSWGAGDHRIVLDSRP